MPETAIRGVTFDWWHTIAETPWPDFDDRMRTLRVERIAEALAGEGRVVDVGALYTAYDRLTEVLAEGWRHLEDRSPERQIQAFLDFAGIDGAEPALEAAVGTAFGEAIHAKLPILYPHIRTILLRLREAGYRVGLVSNTGRTWGRFLRPIQDELGIGAHFDVRIFSDEVGWRKPRPEIFRNALDVLGLPARAVVHVGDDVEADIAGARGMGMRAVWFNAGFWPNAHADDADAEIHDHAELLEVLGRWRP